MTLPAAKCPTCGYSMDAATVTKGPDVPPIPGDIAVCLKCGEALVYNQDLTLRLPTLDDALSWDSASFSEVSRAQRLIRSRRPLDQ